MSAILDKYKLTFTKKVFEDGDTYYRAKTSDKQHTTLAVHLGSLDKEIAEMALEFLETAENNPPPHEGFFMDTTDVEYNPPTAIIDEETDNYQLPMEDLKQLYHEWINYLESQGE